MSDDEGRYAEYHIGWQEGYAEAAAENEKLRAALKPFADEVEYVPSQMDDDDWYEMDTIKVGHIRAAAAAYKETNND